MTLNQPIRLRPAYQRYDWGTARAITDLMQLAPPDGDQPVAELWMGAHPALPSPLSAPVLGQTDLQSLIQAAPADVLGARHEQLGNRLPFLFKVLSADRALSVQVHPDKSQAEAGFADENARGIALSDPTRNYKDDNHKPELLMALTDFQAMAGFRTPEAVVSRLSLLATAVFQDWVEALRRDGLSALKALYAWLLERSPQECSALLAESLVNLPEDDEDCVWVRRLHDQFGDDAGVLFPLLLNRFSLRPGEAIVLAAGVPHAYLQGTGLEVMASSDNVLRGGLTSKHMDVPELLRITQVMPDAVQPQRGRTEAGVTRFDVPFDDFQLDLCDLSVAPCQLGVSGVAELALVIDGECRLAGEIHGPGSILVLPAAMGPVEAQGLGAGQGRLARVYTRMV